MKNVIRVFALAVVAAGIVASHSSSATTTTSSHQLAAAPQPTCNPFTQACSTIRGN